MPYKDKEQQKEATRRAVAKHRQGITQEGITSQGITLLSRPNGPDYNPDELLPDGSKRYMGPFHDGQVLDRTTVPYSMPPGVGDKSGDHPFYGIPSVIFTPLKMGSSR